MPPKTKMSGAPWTAWYKKSKWYKTGPTKLQIKRRKEKQLRKDKFAD